jgi:hypothetical protein
VNRALKWGAGLIAGYLVLTHYTGFAKDVSAGSSGAVSITKALQGR